MTACLAKGNMRGRKMCPLPCAAQKAKITVMVVAREPSTFPNSQQWKQDCQFYLNECANLFNHIRYNQFYEKQPLKGGTAMAVAAIAVPPAMVTKL